MVDKHWIVPLAILAALAAVVGLAVRQAARSRARRRMTIAFRNRLSADAIAALARKPDLLERDGKARTVTALCCTLRDYSALSARFVADPGGFATLVGTIMSPLLALARDSGGMICSFSGDSFTAVWNAPLADSAHAVKACGTAERTSTSLDAINARLCDTRYPDGAPLGSVEIGIGIATGEAVMGAFGDGDHAYLVTGEPLLLARHLAGLSGQYGFTTLLSAQTRALADESFALLEVDAVAGLRGPPLQIFALFGNSMQRASPKFRALSTFHDHIFLALRAKQWQKATKLIEQCRKLSGASQKLYDLHEARIAWYEKNPPPTDWDGAFRSVLR